MTTALIDNATLTGMQRILGQVPSRSRDSIDVDLVAFENFVQARLFYDDVSVIDDYIPALRDARHNAFPQVKHIDLSALGLQQIANTADTIAADIHPKIQGGNFVNADFQALFELLQSHMVCTWDISGSIYHLTLKVLADDGSQEFQKYGAVATAIFQELGEAKNAGQWLAPNVELVDRFGQIITKGYTVPGARWGLGETGEPSGAIPAFVASLVWVANRAVFYTLAAAHLKADSFLYPIRQAYQQHYIAQRFQYHADFPRRLVSQVSTLLSQDVVEVHTAGSPGLATCDLPVFSAWFAQQCGDPSAILHALEEIRLHPPFVEARIQLNELHEAFHDQSLAHGNRRLEKLTNAVRRVSASMREKYSVKTRQGIPVTRLVTVYNALGGMAGFPPLPEIDLRIPFPPFLRDMRREVGFSAVYRNVMNDLATVASLGELHDVMSRRVEIDPKAVAYAPKAESRRYRRSHSPFKSPM
jgi:hypothetical protein